MQKLHAFMRKIVLAVVDAFYPPFKKFMPLQTFRYGACGGANMILDIAVFTYINNYIFHQHVVYIGSFAFKSFVVAFVISFCITFPIGFYLSRYVVWQQTEAKKRIQVFRYFIVVAACVGLNYILLNLFTLELKWWPLPSKLITTVIVVLFSYITQRNYSFKPAASTQTDNAAEIEKVNIAEEN
ncbi:MAG: GtrA family protein [Parafilimonas sp.]